MDRLIIACYWKYLGRAPSDRPEVDNWLVIAATARWTAADVVAHIAASPEAKTHAAGK